MNIQAQQNMRINAHVQFTQAQFAQAQFAPADTLQITVLVVFMRLFIVAPFLTHTNTNYIDLVCNSLTRCFSSVKTLFKKIKIVVTVYSCAVSSINSQTARLKDTALRYPAK